ncbi:MAG TPA: MFS transporter [Mycobacteriales bacterium]|nr:MFS transporter [Mycobacteriales bacterium]
MLPATSGVVRRQRRGWYWYAWASHTFPTTVTTVFMSRYLTSVAETAVGGRNGRLHVLGIPIAPGSLFVYLVSFSTVLLVVLMPVTGALADRTGRKRELLLGLGYAGAAACVLMWFVRGGNWKLGALLYFLAFVAYSCAAVVYHSMLCDLAGPEDRDRVSSYGWAFSYVGGGILLAVNFAFTFFIADRAVVARLSLMSAGVWWAAFAVVPLLALRGPLGGVERSVAPPVGSLVAAGFQQLRQMFSRLRSFPLTVFFLVAFLVYNDGIQTVTTVAAQYGDKELHLSESTLLSAILLVQFVAFGGALLLGRIAGWFGAKRVVLGSLVGWILVVVLAYGMRARDPVQFFEIAMLIALVLGGSQALSRSMFSHLVPAGEEAEYFGLYEVSDSGTSWLGPLLFGLAFQNTGSYRSALFSLVVFFVVGFVLLAFVPVRRAIVAVGNTVPARV